MRSWKAGISHSHHRATRFWAGRTCTGPGRAAPLGQRAVFCGVRVCLAARWDRPVPHAQSNKVWSLVFIYLGAAVPGCPGALVTCLCRLVLRAGSWLGSAHWGCAGQQGPAQHRCATGTAAQPLKPHRGLCSQAPSWVAHGWPRPGALLGLGSAEGAR